MYIFYEFLLNLQQTGGHLMFNRKSLSNELNNLKRLDLDNNNRILEINKLV